LTEQERRDRIVAIARTWMLTPYHENARIRGAGVDCAWLIYEVFREAGECPVIEIPPYSPQWHLHNSDELYLQRVIPHAREIDQAEAKPADLIMYQIGRVFAHGAILVAPGQIIHAFKEAHCVMQSSWTEGYLAEMNGKPRPRRFFTVF